MTVVLNLCQLQIFQWWEHNIAGEKKLADTRRESEQAVNRVTLATALAFPADRSRETLDLMTCLESISLKYL